ncbi:MAG: SH3 domain-containing protein [Candidatus Margulisiibacteriota bacterium]
MFSKIIMVMILGSTLFVHADSLGSAFQKANQFYKAEQYQKALEGYLSINGLARNGTIFYNIGNCHYKLGHWIQAKYFYDKAQDYIPADRDLRFNLELVNLQFQDDIEQNEPLWIQWYFSVINAFSLEFILWMALVLLSLGTAMGLVYLVAGRQKLHRNILLGYVFLAIGLTGAFLPRMQWIFSSKSALVVSDRVEVRSGPDSKFATLFVLHQGTKVKILEHSGNWVSLQASSRLEGWAPLQDFVRYH